MRELVSPPGTNSWSCVDDHPGQTHGLRAELGWSLKAHLEYGRWLVKTIAAPSGTLVILSYLQSGERKGGKGRTEREEGISA